MVDKCFNIDCEDNNAEAENGCYFDDTSNCIGFVSKEQWKEKMTGLGLKKFSDPEYGCTPERNDIDMEDNKKGGTPPNTGDSRMNAGAVLDDKIERCEMKLNSLKALKDSINWETLSKKDEELLWHLFVLKKWSNYE